MKTLPFLRNKLGGPWTGRRCDRGAASLWEWRCNSRAHSTTFCSPSTWHVTRRPRPKRLSSYRGAKRRPCPVLTMRSLSSLGFMVLGSRRSSAVRRHHVDMAATELTSPLTSAMTDLGDRVHAVLAAELAGLDAVAAVDQRARCTRRLRRQTCGPKLSASQSSIRPAERIMAVGGQSKGVSPGRSPQQILGLQVTTHVPF